MITLGPRLTDNINGMSNMNRKDSGWLNIKRPKSKLVVVVVGDLTVVEEPQEVMRQ